MRKFRCQLSNPLVIDCSIASKDFYRIFYHGIQNRDLHILILEFLTI